MFLQQQTEEQEETTGRTKAANTMGVFISLMGSP